MAKKPANDQSKDKVTDTDNGVIGNGNEDRLKMMAEINDRNDEQLAGDGDLRGVNDDGTTSDYDGSDDDREKTDEEIIEEEEDAAALEASEEDDDAEPVEEEPIVKHKIKVNGKEIELTTQELIERAQKVEAADDYLAQAAKKLRDTDDIPASQELSKEDAAEKALENKRRFVRAIQVGSEEEAMAALDQLASENNPSSIKEDDVSRIVEQRMAFNDAYTKFQQEYPEIVNDPILWGVAVQIDAELTNAGDTSTYWDRYQKIGNQIRTWKDSIVKSSTEKSEKQTAKAAEKQQRKASTSAVPKGAGAKAPQAVDEEDKEESPSEIIANMAKSRGGPQWLRG